MRGKRLFGTDGVRGVVGSELTPEFSLRLALAIGTYFESGSKILVGHDARAGNNYLVRAVLTGLLSTGVKVYLAGPVPTPALQYYIKSNGFDGGVMITASHNPPEYSGVKVIASDGVEAPREVEEEVEKIFWELRFRRTAWTELDFEPVRVGDVVEKYVEGIRSLVDVEAIKKKGWKVVVDCANNVGCLATPKLLRSLGVHVVVVNGELTHMPNRLPEPTPENLRDAAEIVKVLSADLAVTHDGDADRAIFIDRFGNVVMGDRSAIILCKHIVANRGERRSGKVVTAVSSTPLIEEELKELGIEVVWTKVGSIGISRLMMKLDAVAGFEENGGFMYPPHQYVRDGAMTTALMLEALTYNRSELHEELSKFPKVFVIKTKVRIARPEAVQRALELIKERYKDFRLITVDGVKIIGRDFWALVRPSGTEPIMRIFVEAESQELVREVLKDLEDLVKREVGES